MLAGIACATIGFSFIVLCNPRRAPTWIEMPAPTDGPARSSLEASLEAALATARLDESRLHSTSARTISDKCAPAASSIVISVAGHIL